MESSVASKAVKASTNTGSQVVLSPQKLRFEELLKNPISKSIKGNCPITGKKPTTSKTPNQKNKTLKRSHLTAFECINSSPKEDNPKKKKMKKNPQKPAGLLHPNMKNLKIPSFQIWWKKLRQERRIICGIDMSLTNPGLCLLNPVMKTIHLFCFRNRKKESSGLSYITHSSSPFKDWTLEISVLEEREEDQPSLFAFSLFRFSRYEERLQKLLSLIGDNMKQDKLVGIEGYSYNSKSTQADTFLKELGGCLRLSLCRMKHNIMEIPPSTIKKIFSTQGQSTKNDMYKAYQEKFYLPDLFSLMNIGKVEEFKDVPHPIEDLIDSLAVALSVLYLI
jgi:hypothetical protein